MMFKFFSFPKLSEIIWIQQLFIVSVEIPFGFVSQAVIYNAFGTDFYENSDDDLE
jgi:hypothetical protein